MVDGARIAPEDTADTLGLDDDDHIDVVMEQTEGSGTTDMMTTMNIAAIAMDTDMGGDTGLSQDMRGLGFTSPSILVSDNSTVLLQDEMLRVFIEQDIVQVMPMVCNQDMGGVRVPTSWDELQNILGKLGYAFAAQDHWQVLGLAMLDGPDPSLQIILGRKRAAMLLCELVFNAQWPEVQTKAAKDFSSKIERAAAHCEDSLDSVLSQRRKLKTAKLPLHKELGDGAFKFIQSLVSSMVHLLGPNGEIFSASRSSPLQSLARRDLWQGWRRRGTRNFGLKSWGRTWYFGPRRTTMPSPGCCPSFCAKHPQSLDLLRCISSSQSR